MTDTQRLRAFSQGFQNLRRAAQSSLCAGDADDLRRSAALTEIYLGEVRSVYDLLPAAMREAAWLVTSVQRGA